MKNHPSFIQHILHKLSVSSLLFFALWAFILSFEYFSFGSYSYVRMWEDGETALEGKLALSPHLMNVRIGYWNPLPAGGVDTLSNSFLFNIDSICIISTS